MPCSYSQFLRNIRAHYFGFELLRLVKPLMHQMLIHQLRFFRLREEISLNVCWSVSFSLWLVRGFTLTLVYEGQGKLASV